MSEYLTTLQAAELLNTTDRTIRRKVSVLPPELVRYVRKKGRTILIDKRLVIGNFERLQELEKEQEATAEPLPPPPETKADTTDSTTAELIKLLKEQLQEKDKQINHLQQLNSELTERNREQNIIIANMQQERQNLSISAPTELKVKRTFLQWLFRIKN